MREPRVKIARGETSPLKFEFFDSEGNEVDISSAQQVIFSLSYSPTLSLILQKHSTVDEGILISENSITVYFTDDESQSLPIGKLYADIWVKISDKWSRIDSRILVEVEEGIGNPFEEENSV